MNQYLTTFRSIYRSNGQRCDLSAEEARLVYDAIIERAKTEVRFCQYLNRVGLFSAQGLQLIQQEVDTVRAFKGDRS